MSVMVPSLQCSNPSFLSSDFTTEMDLSTGRFFYHSEWGALFSMLPYDVQDNIAQAIWRYVYSNRVLEIPHPLAFTEADESYMPPTADYWIDEHMSAENKKLHLKLNSATAILDAFNEFCNYIVDLIEDEYPLIQYNECIDTHQSLHKFNVERYHIKMSLIYRDATTPTHDEMMSLGNSRTIVEKMCKVLRESRAFCGRSRQDELYELEYETSRISIRRVIGIISDYVNRQFIAVENIQRQLNMDNPDEYERRRDLTARLLENRNSGNFGNGRNPNRRIRLARWETMANHLNVSRKDGDVEEVCHCFNKNGTICGARPQECVVVGWSDGLIPVPDGVCGIEKHTHKSTHPGLDRLYNMRVCGKHYKEMMDDDDGDEAYFNRLFRKWGYDEKHGYPVKAFTTHGTHIHGGTCVTHQGGAKVSFHCPKLSGGANKKDLKVRAPLILDSEWSQSDVVTPCVDVFHPRYQNVDWDGKK